MIQRIKTIARMLTLFRQENVVRRVCTFYAGDPTTGPIIGVLPATPNGVMWLRIEVRPNGLLAAHPPCTSDALRKWAADRSLRRLSADEWSYGMTRFTDLAREVAQGFLGVSDAIASLDD